MTDPWNESVLVIEPEYRNYRYLFSDGNVLDVSSPYQANSNDREKALAEADRRWGKKVSVRGSMGDRKIEGVSLLPNTVEVPSD